MTRALLRAALRVARFLGWCALLACALAQVLEHGGLARRAVAELAGARLASLGGELHLGGLDIDWLRPSLTFRDVRLTEDGLDAPRTWIALERAELDLRLAFDGVRVRGVHVSSGEVFLNPRLHRGVRALLDEPGEGGAGAPTAPRRFEVTVRDLGIAVEALGEELVLGRVDARLGRDAHGALALEGVLRAPAPPAGVGNGTVYLSGTETQPGSFDLRASANDLVLGPELLPAGGVFADLRAFEPRGRLRLSGSGRLDLGPRRSSGELRLSLAGGSLRVPTSPDPIRGLELELGARYEPELGQDPWEPRAWRGTAHGACRWRELDLVAGALFGRAARPGALLEAWARAPAAAFDAALIELSGERRELLEIAAALAPEQAAADVRVGLRLRDDVPEGAPWERGLEFVLDAQVAPGTRLSYQGWPSRGGRPEPAFPLPSEARRGRVVFAHAGRLVRPDLLVVEGSALHGSGAARVLYQGWSPARDTPPFAPGYGRPEMDLVISTPRVAIDAALRRGVEGLGDDPSLAGIWEQYEPAGGHAAVALRLAQRADMAAPALDLVVDVEQVGARFAELPVPVRELSGRVRVRTDGRGGLGVAFDLEGRGEDTARVAIRGRTRRWAPRGGPARRLLDVLGVQARGFEGAGREARLLGELVPAVALALEELRPSGALDLDLERVQGLEDGPLATRLEVSAVDLALAPPRAPTTTLGVAGRALVELEERPPEAPLARVRVPGLAGRLPGGARVAWRGTPTELSPDRGSLVVAGLELGEALGLTGFSPAPEGPPAGFAFEGWVDLSLELDAAASATGSAEGAASAPRLRALLRSASLGRAGGLGLEELRGALVLEGELLRAERLRGRLARTELEFQGAVLRPGRGDGAGPELETGLVARGLTLDAEHLALFFDPTTVNALLEDLEGRGQIDVEAGRLRLWNLDSERPSAEFEGTLLLSDVTATLGLPLSIRSAGARIERLVVEDGGVRAFGRLFDLYGRAAGLELGPANLLVSLVDTRLVVEELSGTFERGWLRTLGRDSATRPGPALALELRPPFPFQLAVELSGVDVARVLRGVFPANMADRGDLDARVRLSGSLENLLELRGEGALELRRTRLWSIPVFRELFLRLGFDRTLLFDQLSGRFRLLDGRLHLSSLEAKSPIVKLVGSGHVDLDGALSSDLEVRYSLVDKLPTLRRLVYLLQNTLLVVAVRGDLERPEVVLRGEFERLFRPVGKGRRRLPLPGFSPLPERF